MRGSLGLGPGLGNQETTCRAMGSHHTDPHQERPDGTLPIIWQPERIWEAAGNGLSLSPLRPSQGNSQEARHKEGHTKESRARGSGVRSVQKSLEPGKGALDGDRVQV